MAEEKKKLEEEKAEEKPTEQTPDTPPRQKAEPPNEEPKAEEKPTDKPQEEKKGEGEKVPKVLDESQKTSESETESETEPEIAPPELSEADRLKEENFRLKTQLEAMKIGFSPEVIEDAVVLAENIVKKDGSDISTALQAVAKKYPDWKSDSKNGKSKSGFKVGADTSGSKPTSDEKLNKAFGIKK